MARTLVQNATAGSPITLPAPLHAVLAPGEAVVSSMTPDELSTLMHLSALDASIIKLTALPEGLPLTSGLHGPLDMTGEKIVNLAPGVALTDAANVSQLGAGGVSVLIRWLLADSWLDVYTAIGLAVGPVLVLVEGDPTGTPRSMLGVADQDLSQVLFVGVPRELGARSVSVNIEIGTTLAPGVLRSRDVLWLPQAPDIVSGVGAPAYQVDFDGGGLRATPGTLGGGAVFRARSGEINRLRLRNGAVWDGTGLAAGESVSRIRPSVPGEVVLEGLSYGGVIGPSAFLNPALPTPNPPFPPTPTTGVVQLDADAKTFIDPAYQAPGGLSPVSIQAIPASRDNASLVAYDDALAPPAVTGAADVQTALDVVKYASGVYYDDAVVPVPSIGAEVQTALDTLKGIIPATYRVDQIVRSPQVAGQQGFLLPLGSYVNNDPANIVVEISTDGGTTWIPQAFGADYSFTVRRWGTWPQPSTADVASGIQLTGPAALAWLVRLTWRTTTLQIVAPEPALVRLLGGAVDLTMQFWRYNGVFPNGALLPDRAGLSMEAWRWGTSSGKARPSIFLPGYTTILPGRRWRPYYRYTVAVTAGDLIVNPTVYMNKAPRQQRWRFCYYDPTTGGRSPLSTATLRWQNGVGERVQGNVMHPQGSMWLSAT